MRISKGNARKAIALALLGAALILPGSAKADHSPPINHYTCTPPNCPGFVVSSSFGVQNPVTDAPSALHFTYGQPDRAMPVIRADYFLPKGWRFGGLSTLRAAQDATDPDAGTTPTDCNDGIFGGGGGVSRAEAITPDTGMRVFVAALRNNSTTVGHAIDYAGAFDPSFTQADAGNQYDYGYRNPGGTVEGSRNPAVVFLDWDGTTARLCYYHRNNAIDNDWGSTAPQEFIQPATLTRLSGDPQFDWKLSIDVSSVYNNDFNEGEQTSILKHDIGLSEVTAGNWNRHPVTGLPSKAIFSHTPTDPGDYPFRGVFYTCAYGLSGTGNGCDDGGAPGAADDFTSVVKDQIVQISPAANNLRHDFGLMTGAGDFTSRLCNSANCAAGLVLGSNSFTASWKPPALPAGVGVKGYVLVIAEPGNQASRVFKRFVINDPLDPDYDATVCSGTGGTCSLPLSFPMQSTDGSTTLTGDGKYNLALVTMYTDSLRRSDGVCDNPTGATAAARATGVTCAATVPRIKVTDPGVSTWQVLLRPHAWPNKFIATSGDNNNAPYEPFINRLMLIDWANKKGEFIIWNNNDKVTIYKASSATIIGDASMGGLASFFSPSLAGSTVNWRADFVVEPVGSAARGIFTTYDLKNPSVQPIAIAGAPDFGGTIFVAMAKF